MDQNMYGYVRVSAVDQNVDRQLIAMEAFGVAQDKIVVEAQSGKDFNRPEYRRLLRRLRTGDTLVIKSIDRLGRNYDEILEQWRHLTKERQISIVVLDMPLLDTRHDRDLTGVLIADIVLQLLSYVAQTERENIRQRQQEGIEAAKAKGVRFGRPRTPLPDGFGEIVHHWRQGEYTSTQAASRIQVSRSYFYKLVKELDTREELPFPAFLDTI